MQNLVSRTQNHRVVPVDVVVSVKPQGLADPHPGHRQQPDHRGQRVRPEPKRRGHSSTGDDRGDIIIEEQIRAAATPIGNEPGRRDLGARVGACQEASEATHRRQPLARDTAVRVEVGVEHERQRRCHRHRVLADVVEVGHQPGQVPALGHQLVSQRAAQPQVVRQRRVQSGHRVTAGHGSASSRNEL
ncbi:MAG: hypothetical protein ACM30G_07390 [Micromonosporaceae bacterium]